MILEDGPPSYKQALERFERLLTRFSTDDSILQKGLPTGYMLTQQIETALLEVAEAKQNGEDLQQAIDKAWVVFNREYPIGS
jgi:hypothetical protein